jgi:hypothetical protein
MNPPKCRPEDYIQWLIASPKVVSCTQAAKASPLLVAHDAYTRLLQRIEPTSQELWSEVQSLVSLKTGWLVIDDTTLDKPYARKMELVTRHWSGKHQCVVQGINLISLLWTDGDIAIPVDWRVFDKERDHLTKNDHLCQMLQTARLRGFEPTAVLWDSWYSSLKNLKMLRTWGWRFFVALKSNRLVDPDGKGNRAVRDLSMKTGYLKAHLKGFGWVELYRVVETKGKSESVRFFIGSEEVLDESEIQQRRETAYQIEGYHRGLKQECHIERCQARSGRKQKNHVGLAIRAFLRLEQHRFNTGISRFESKASIIREAIRSYLRKPLLLLE